MNEAVTAPAPKIDSETLAIRARSARAICFRRGVIVAIAAPDQIAALGSISLMWSLDRAHAPCFQHCR